MNRKNKQENTYNPLNHFIVRSHLLPIEQYNNLLNFNIKDEQSVDQWIKRIKKNDLIMEAIYISSITLFKSIEKWNTNLKKKKKRNIVRSLMQFLIRMTSRSTPYGLFAGVSFGHFSKTTTQFQIDNYKTHTEPNMNWIFTVVRELESDIYILRCIKLKFNPLAISNGNRLDLRYNSQGGINKDKFENQELTSIKITPPVQLIIDNASKPVEGEKLIQAISNKYIETPKIVIENLILQLIEQDFLITELRPSLLSNESPIDFLINKLNILPSGIEKKGQLLNQLTDIKNKLFKYDNKQAGEGLKSIIELDNDMSSLSNEKNNLQVNTTLKHDPILLDDSIKEDLSEAVEILLMLSDFQALNHLEGYKQNFMEKYGTYREVPLLELLSEETGLGPPPTYKNPKGSNNTIQANNQGGHEKEKFLLEKIMWATKNNKRELKISKKELNERFDSSYKTEKNLINDIEVFGSIYALNKQELENNNYNLILSSPHCVSYGIGQAIGRFLHINELSPLNKLLSEHSIYTKRLNKDKIIAEATYMPTNGKISNVMRTKNFYDYEISIGTNEACCEKGINNIPLSDILVGISEKENNFYLKSKNLNKEILVNVNNMVINTIMPNALRFLIEVTTDDKGLLNSLNKGILQTSIYFPRVRYKNIILSLATWNITNSRLGAKQSATFDEWIRFFKVWANEWDLPRFVYIVEKDNRLLIDTSKEQHLFLLYERLKKMEGTFNFITLEEKETNTFENWVQDINGQSFNAEFIFPMIKRKQNHKTVDTTFPPIKRNEKKSLSTSSEIVTKRPGSEWFYIKLYHNPLRENELICQHLFGFCKKMIEKGIIKEYFFLRYRDPHHHIRLRFYGDPDIMNQKLLSYIKEWTDMLDKSGVLNNIKIPNYEREVERYGGPELIKKVESHFYIDSKCVSQMLQLQNDLSNVFDQDVLATISVVHLLKSVLYERNSKVFESIDNIKSNKYYSSQFRKKRDTLVNLCNDDNNWENLRSQLHGEKLLHVLEVKTSSFKKILRQINANCLAYNSYENIFLSILL